MGIYHRSKLAKEVKKNEAVMKPKQIRIYDFLANTKFNFVLLVMPKLNFTAVILKNYFVYIRSFLFFSG